uniref:Kinesin-like protein KIF15 isoform X5 n=1 Tax=Crassostrea virginica TaxID=6565 RepID=A0A8B8AHG9_CRAVI|nr:kinesin-like protein KIF15 isoform X5 [Crassostrea virginica]
MFLMTVENMACRRNFTRCLTSIFWSLGLLASFTVESPCYMSLPTIEKVDKCPSTPEEVMLAIKNKRCSSLKDAQTCVEDPAKFKYQCLLNEKKNGFVEFCAPEWKLNGFCGFFDTTNGQIHNDVNKDCTTFQVNPCPSSFLSSDSYQYQGCLKIDSNVTKTQEETSRSTDPSSTTANYRNTTVDTNNVLLSADNNLYYLFLLLLLPLIGFGIFVWYMYCKSQGKTIDSPFLGCRTKNDKDNELPSEEREDEPGPHENLEDENNFNVTQRSPLLDSSTGEDKNNDLPSKEREDEPAPHENLKGTKPFEETSANGRKTQGIQFTNNQQKTADADQVILGSTADHTEITPHFQEPAMVNESNSEELETERDDQGFEKETEECPEKSDKKKNQSMDSLESCVHTLSGQETTENEECGNHEASGATGKAEETHSRDTLETVTSTDIDLLKPSVKECLMEALSIFIENVVDSLGRDKRPDVIISEFDGQFRNYRQEREIKEIRQKIYSIEQRQEEVDQLKEKIKYLENSVIDIKAFKNEECHQLKTELREKDNLSTKRNTEIEQLKTKLKEKEKEIDQLKEELKSIKEKCESNSMNRKQKK